MEWVVAERESCVSVAIHPGLSAGGTARFSAEVRFGAKS